MNPEPLTYEKIMTMFTETKQIIQDTALQSKETERQFQKMSKETDKKLRKLENLFNGQWGRLMESLVEGDLVPLLRSRGIHVKDTSRRRTGKYQGYDFEIDIIAHDGDKIVLVEVKTTLTPEHVRNFLNKLDVVQSVFSDYQDKTIYAGVAYLRAESEAQTMAMRQGLFAIKATGKSAYILNTIDFQPHNFSTSKASKE